MLVAETIYFGFDRSLRNPTSNLDLMDEVEVLTLDGRSIERSYLRENLAKLITTAREGMFSAYTVRKIPVPGDFQQNHSHPVASRIVSIEADAYLVNLDRDAERMVLNWP